ncbi:MAG: CheR family methyltransferase [bacterium]
MNDSVSQMPQNYEIGTMMQISDKEFLIMRDLIYDHFGINLTEQKKSLLVGRLQKQIRCLGFTNFKDYYNYLTSDKTGQALSTLVNFISTNYTFFSREKEHFDYFTSTALPNVIAQVKNRNERQIRIWCAGCSSGQEAYMLAMLVLDYLGKEYGSWDAGILATDISVPVLEKARAGIYPDEQIKVLPKKFLYNYFKNLGRGEWAVNEKVKKEITFRRFNLMNKQFPFKKPFQIIFCRNVMIYFDQPTRDALVKNFHQFLEPNGYLFIGHSESIGRGQNLFKYIKPALYRRI